MTACSSTGPLDEGWYLHLARMSCACVPRVSVCIRSHPSSNSLMTLIPPRHRPCLYLHLARYHLLSYQLHPTIPGRATGLYHLCQGAARGLIRPGWLWPLNPSDRSSRVIFWTYHLRQTFCGTPRPGFVVPGPTTALLVTSGPSLRVEFDPPEVSCVAS